MKHSYRLINIQATYCNELEILEGIVSSNFSPWAPVHLKQQLLSTIYTSIQILKLHNNNMLLKGQS